MIFAHSIATLCPEIDRRVLSTEVKKYRGKLKKTRAGSHNLLRMFAKITAEAVDTIGIREIFIRKILRYR